MSFVVHSLLLISPHSGSYQLGELNFMRINTDEIVFNANSIQLLIVMYKCIICDKPKCKY